MARRPLKLGLTGSIAMGKSTTARIFKEEGVPVWDADESVRSLYAEGGAGVPVIRRLVAAAIHEEAVDRSRLREAIARDPALLDEIEARIHPLVAADRAEFLARQGEKDVVLFDIPLLYETGAEKWLDRVVVVTADAGIQRCRVLKRGTMSETDLERILARQMPDAEKRRLADFVVRSDQGLEVARQAVRKIIDIMRSGRPAD
jgi:dephospho-CoA kinase